MVIADNIVLQVEENLEKVDNKLDKEIIIYENKQQ